MTALINVTYPRSGGTRFDYEYYRDKHTPLVKDAWSPTAVRLAKGVSAPDGGPAPYFLIAEIEFATAEALQAALASARTPEVLGDVARFTDVQPAVQIGASLD